MEQKKVPTNRLHLENKNRNLSLTIILQEIISSLCLQGEVHQFRQERNDRHFVTN